MVVSLGCLAHLYENFGVFRTTLGCLLGVFLQVYENDRLWGVFRASLGHLGVSLGRLCASFLSERFLTTPWLFTDF